MNISNYLFPNQNSKNGKSKKHGQIIRKNFEKKTEEDRLFLSGGFSLEMSCDLARSLTLFQSTRQSCFREFWPL